MKPRDLIDIVRPDHVPTLTMGQPGIRDLAGQPVSLRCSCGYKTSRMENTEFAVMHPEVSMALREQWLYREMTEHLLDEDVDMSEIDP